MQTKDYYRLLRLNRLIKSHRPKVAGVLLLHLLRRRHLFIRFDPALACNLRCRMCYFSNDDYRKREHGVFTPADVERLARLFFPLALQLNIGCIAEPTTYKHYASLVKIAKSYKVPHVGFVTNGQALDEQNLDELVDFGLDELIISVHGCTKETYENRLLSGIYG
jgi:molybdenum cofactor biosynthesis enzyme MoaA